MNEHSGNSGQLQQRSAAAGLNEPFGDSEQLARPDTGSGGDALPPLPEPQHMGSTQDSCMRIYPVMGYTAKQMQGYARATLAAHQPVKKKLRAELALADQQLADAMRALSDADRQPVGVEPAVWVSPEQLAAHADPGRGEGGHYLPARKTQAGKFTQPLYTAPPAQADRMAIKMLVAAGFVSEEKANESLRIAHGFGGDLGQPAAAAVPAPDLLRTIAQLNRMRIVLRNARAYVENFTCKSALPPVQQKMIGQIDEVLGALAHAWPTAVPVDASYSLDADPAGIRSRVADCIAGTMMVGAQNHTPPPAGHWLEPFWNMARADVTQPQPAAVPVETFQAGVSKWMGECFLPSLYSNMTERGDRLLEEVLELLQSHGYDQTRVATLVDYVYGRPVGEPAQEVGGVMVTLAGYCWVAGLDMHAEGARELERITQPEVMAKIRRKQEAKNALHFDTPLPGHATHPQPAAAGGDA
ncbi:hypothetical protein [Xanthomonas arboricola]|uniref:hypothetical protein n=1 Tax=Xanthomonas arboricola TaxID=56448 RepID=UPI00118BDEFF|nr:hypothetical protein [Xanthomonas arboricola]QDS15744.1 hypothetical protein FPL04_08870 [Xanthomonas arboricola]